MKNDNKGFSLIELIVVIAIMAILVGALAPQLIKYIDKARISTDTQAIGAVYTAVQTAVADPMVNYNPGTSTETYSTGGTALPTALNDEVTGTLGRTLAQVKTGLKSSAAKNQDITITIDPTGNVTVTAGTITVDATGSTVSS